MKGLAVTLIGSGFLGLFGFYLGAIKGEIKWSPEEKFTGAKARVVGMISLLIGLVLLAVGGYMATYLFA